MTDDDRPPPENAGYATIQRSTIAESAQGWQRLQLAALGFIGLCGLLWDGVDAAGFEGITILLMILIAVGYVLAIVAIFVVGRVAHGFAVPAERSDSGREALAVHARRLRAGVWMTYVAVALVVAATLSSWLPGEADDGAVVVGDVTGRMWCGELAEAPARQARLITAEGTVDVALERVALLRPVDAC